MPQIVLSQLAPAPPDLPAPPFLSHLFLESPAAAVTLFLSAAVLAVLVLNSRGLLRRGLVIGVLLAGCALGVLVLASVVHTDREAMIDATGALVRAVARADRAGMERLLASDVRLLSRFELGNLRTPATGWDKPTVLQRAVDAMGREYPVQSVEVIDAQAQSFGSGAGRTQVRVRVVPEGWNVPHTSWWRLEWRRDPGGEWRVVTITPLAIDGLGSVPG
jgi:hypothetical protein